MKRDESLERRRNRKASILYFASTLRYWVATIANASDRETRGRYRAIYSALRKGFCQICMGWDSDARTECEPFMAEVSLYTQLIETLGAQVQAAEESIVPGSLEDRIDYLEKGLRQIESATVFDERDADSITAWVKGYTRQVLLGEVTT